MIPPRIVSVAAALVLIAALSRPASTFASAEDVQESESMGTQFAYGAASTLLTIVHVPLKATLCGVTSVMSGVAYLLTFGSKPVAKDTSEAVKAVCTGPYIITPQRLRVQGE